MGFFGDLANLTTQADGMRSRMDVGATMAAAQASMADAGRLMAAAAPVATTSAQDAQRLRTTAGVVAARPLPMALGMDLLVELDLHVRMPGGVPMPVTRIEQVSPVEMGRIQPGAELPVSIVPGAPGTVRVEWGL
ncbi:hypothetical protein [Microbacterium candidum]|uniref:Uncharacterized protein n=1 Tax=Microbacterium candidum TaxID=3041922 RepID=A0ABT7MXI0_9MICO|nr:hypothetical protein [Microbacterium sp. ASV49]MDL9979162.1 hypothetical protein [Microbacterium sp. ASV49]